MYVRRCSRKNEPSIGVRSEWDAEGTRQWWTCMDKEHSEVSQIGRSLWAAEIITTMTTACAIYDTEYLTHHYCSVDCHAYFAPVTKDFNPYDSPSLAICLRRCPAVFSHILLAYNKLSLQSSCELDNSKWHYSWLMHWSRIQNKNHDKRNSSLSQTLDTYHFPQFCRRAWFQIITTSECTCVIYCWQFFKFMLFLFIYLSKHSIHMYCTRLYLSVASCWQRVTLLSAVCVVIPMCFDRIERTRLFWDASFVTLSRISPRSMVVIITIW